MKKILKRTGKDLRDARGAVEGDGSLPALPAADGGLVEGQGPGEKDLVHGRLPGRKPGVVGLDAPVDGHPHRPPPFLVCSGGIEYHSYASRAIVRFYVLRCLYGGASYR